MSNDCIEYLKKCYRELPVGICREFLILHEARFNKQIDNRIVSGTTSGERLASDIAYANTLKKCLEQIDDAINECGPDVPMSVVVDLTEDDAVDLFLKMMRMVG